MISARSEEFAGVLSTLIPGSATDEPVSLPTESIFRRRYRNFFKKWPSIDMDGALTIACHMKKEFSMLLE